MLSILIPTYNYHVVPLAKSVIEQAERIPIPFELIVIDDCSPHFDDRNNALDALNNTNFTRLEKNIGRSKIRNALVEKAQYNWLLFLDADTMPATNDFILNYTKAFDSSTAIFGGISYKPQTDTTTSLRYTYGIKREVRPIEERLKSPYISFTTANFAVKKDVFKALKFDVSHKAYGYEDTVFALELKKNNISMTHIDNPVYHLGLEPNEDYALKIQSSLQNLHRYYHQHKITTHDVKLLKLYRFLDVTKLKGLIGFLFQKKYKRLLNHLSGKHPKLWVFDLYRIGYLCTLKQNNG